MAPARKRERTATAVRFPPEMHDALVEAAYDRDVSLNFLVVRAVERPASTSGSVWCPASRCTSTGESVSAIRGTYE